MTDLKQYIEHASLATGEKLDAAHFSNALHGLCKSLGGIFPNFHALS